MLKTP